jgi:multidrug efflux pump subunit AcrA (membrane-fusion protein)
VRFPEFKANVGEADAVRIHAGDPARVAVHALSDRTYPAHVLSVDPVETSSNGLVSYEVTMVLDRSAHPLKPGLTATAEVTEGRVDNALTVPRTAVRSPEGANPSVIVVGRDGRRDLRLVATGAQTDSEVQILAGVGLDERVLRSVSPPPEP